MARSYGRSVFRFRWIYILSSIMTVFIYISTNSVWGYIFLQPWLCFWFWLIAILPVVKWNLIVAFIRISLVVTDPHHFFMWLLAVYIPSFKKLPVHFLTGTVLKKTSTMILNDKNASDFFLFSIVVHCGSAVYYLDYGEVYFNNL